MSGESQKENDLFFTCSLIEYISRKTKNTKKKVNVPTYWDIGKVYKRLIIMVNNNEDNYIETLIEVLSSWIIDKIDNYNSSMYYENPSYIL